MKRPALQPGQLLLEVRPDEAGLRLDVFLAQRLKLSRNQVVRRLAGQVWHDGRPAERWSQRLPGGSRVLVQGRARPEPDIEVSYRVLERDDRLVVTDKGPGVPVHPVRSFRSRTLVTRLRQDLGDDSLAPAHRLDRETSGLVVFGRGRQEVAALMRQFAAGTVEKYYLAVVAGQPDFASTVVEVPLERDPEFPLPCRMRVAAAGTGQEARTELRVLWRGDDRALLLARPRSGRQHQIRVHLAWLGHPLLGDKLYRHQGRAYLAMLQDRCDREWREHLGHERQALHAWRLELDHPADGHRLRLRADPAPDLLPLLPAAAWQRLDQWTRGG